MNEDWVFTPYNKEVDEAMAALWDFDSFSAYQDNLQIVFDYIDKLEDTIYGYTE